MALQKTQLLDITSVTGIATVGILTVGVTPTAGGVGIASTTFHKKCYNAQYRIRNSASFSYIIQIQQMLMLWDMGLLQIDSLRVDIAPNETTFFESNYPIVLTHLDSLSVEITPPDSGGTGIGSAVNFIVNGDTDIQ